MTRETTAPLSITDKDADGYHYHVMRRAIEIIAMTMAVYLTISLFTSGIMNWYNARVALVER